MNTGGNGTHSHLFNPSLKLTHSIIPYQDIVRVVCKNKYYYSFLHKNYTQLVVQLLPFFCLLFALSTLGVAIREQQVFPPQRKRDSVCCKRADLPCLVASAELMTGADLPSSSLYSGSQYRNRITKELITKADLLQGRKKDSYVLWLSCFISILAKHHASRELHIRCGYVLVQSQQQDLHGNQY